MYLVSKYRNRTRYGSFLASRHRIDQFIYIYICIFIGIVSIFFPCLSVSYRLVFPLIGIVPIISLYRYRIDQLYCLSVSYRLDSPFIGIVSISFSVDRYRIDYFLCLSLSHRLVFLLISIVSTVFSRLLSVSHRLVFYLSVSYKNKKCLNLYPIDQVFSAYIGIVSISVSVYRYKYRFRLHHSIQHKQTHAAHDRMANKITTDNFDEIRHLVRLDW